MIEHRYSVTKRKCVLEKVKLTCFPKYLIIEELSSNPLLKKKQKGGQNAS